MKLIKLNEQHYIIVDDSEIKENQWYCNNKVLFLSDSKFDKGNNPNQNKNNKLVTHSTEPLEVTQWEGKTNLHMDNYHYDKIKPLSISEVEELINGDSVEKMAEKYFKNYYAWVRESTLPYTDEQVDNIKMDYINGFKAHQKLTKDKLFTKRDMIAAFIEGTNSGSNYQDLVENDLEEAEKFSENEMNDFIQSLLPPTEWDVYFNEQDKLELI